MKNIFGDEDLLNKSFNSGSKGSLYWKHTYYEDKRTKKSSTSPEGITTEYDVRGNIVAIEDPDKGRMEYAYNDRNQVTKTKHYDGSVTTDEYDEAGNKIKKVTSRGTYEWKYNSAGDQILRREPSGDIWEYRYDDNHNITWLKLPSGEEERYSYDLSNRLATKRDKTYVQTFKYDTSGNLIEVDIDQLDRVPFISWVVKFDYKVGGELRLVEVFSGNRLVISQNITDKKHAKQVAQQNGGLLEELIHRAVK